MSSLTKRARIFTAVTAPLLLAGATLTVTAPAANAAPTSAPSAAPSAAYGCGHAWSNKSSGKGYPKAGVTVLIRNGPHESCSATWEATGRVLMQYHCWIENSAGNKWTHIRVDGTNINGWVYNPRLDDGGSVHPDNKC
ncbi:SH3 domain-containing protein [Streptomyces sp. NPDC054863]